MLVISYKPNNQGQQISIPPIFLKLDQNLLNLEISALINQLYQQLKYYLSPFVTAEHLRLELPTREVLIRKTPVFFYINYGQFMQQFFCSISSIEQIKEENIVFDNYKFTMVMRISHREETQDCKDRFIIDKQIFIQNMNFKSLLKPDDQFILKGKSKQITLQDFEDRWLTRNWKKYQKQESQCLYICVDRKSNQ